MDIYNYLKKDHRKVADLMEQVCNTTDVSKRMFLYETIRAELSLHAKTEEQTFYKALEAQGGKQLQEKEEHAEEEHDEIRKFLKEIDATSPESEMWFIHFGGLKHAVEHHVEEEEGEIFEKARKVISDKQAVQLAADIEALKGKYQGKKSAA